MVGIGRPGIKCLDVGCGTGTGVEIVAMTMLSKQQSVLVACDFSQGMFARCCERLQASDYNQIKGNKLFVQIEKEFISNQDRVDLDAYLKDQFNKFVYACRANAERLPFADSWFDAYVSNLCLQITTNPELMITEAFRVLKSQGRACFNVWGSHERSVFFSIESQAKKNLGFPTPPKARSNFDLGNDISRIKEFMLQTGFTEVKYWHQQANFPIRTGEDFVNLKPAFPIDRPLTDNETKQRNEMIKLYDELSGKNNHDLCNFELIVILAYKD